MQNQLTLEQLMNGEEVFTIKGSMIVKISMSVLLIPTLGIFVYIVGAVAFTSGGNAWLWFLGVLGLSIWLFFRLFTYRIDIWDGVVTKYTLTGKQTVFLDEIQQIGQINQRAVSGSGHVLGINWVELIMNNGRYNKFGFRGYSMDDANQMLQIFNAAAGHNAGNAGL